MGSGHVDSDQGPCEFPSGGKQVADRGNRQSLEVKVRIVREDDEPNRTLAVGPVRDAKQRGSDLPKTRAPILGLIAMRVS